MEKHLAQHNTKQVEKSLADFFGKGLTKSQIMIMADQSVEHVMDEGNVITVAEALSAMEEFVRTVRKDERFVQFLRDELAKHNGKLVTSSGARIENCEAGVTYDYSTNGEWRALDEAINELVQKKKFLEEKLRSLSPGKIAVDTETGEVIEGANKNSKSTYRVTLSR